VELALRAFTLATTHDVRECCNAVLVSSAMLERRACTASLVTPPAHVPAAGETTAAPASELDGAFLVSCIAAAVRALWLLRCAASMMPACARRIDPSCIG
jgi:hypothetical protein